MRIEEIRSFPIINGYYVICSGKSNASGVVLNWQAIAVEDVSDGYYCLERIITGNEEETENRKEIKYNFFTFLLDLIGFDAYKLGKVSQWHSAEHKIINLFKKGLPLTLEEARKADDIHICCGGNNKLLADPEDFQLLEVLEAGKRIAKQIEKEIKNRG